MKRKIVEIIIVVLCLILIALAGWVFARMTTEHNRIMDSVMEKYIEDGN